MTRQALPYLVETGLPNLFHTIFITHLKFLLLKFPFTLFISPYKGKPHYKISYIYSNKQQTPPHHALLMD